MASYSRKLLKKMYPKQDKMIDLVTKRCRDGANLWLLTIETNGSRHWHGPFNEISEIEKHTKVMDKLSFCRVIKFP